MSKVKFILMKYIGMPIRNKLMPPVRIMDEMLFKNGDIVLDFGCGPGIFTMMLSNAVGENGKVNAADISIDAIKSVDKIVERNNLQNVSVVHLKKENFLESETFDKIIMLDVLHQINDKLDILKKLTSLLKPNSILYFSDHHMKKVEINNLFKQVKSLHLIEDKKYTTSFKKQ